MMGFGSALACLAAAALAVDGQPLCVASAGDSCNHAMRYAVNIVHSGWIVEVDVNDQPAVRAGETSSLWDVTSFVVDGSNEVRLSATRDPRVRMPSTRCEIVILRCSGIPDRKMETLGGIKAARLGEQAEVEARISFTADVPFQWTWQDADDLIELGDADRVAIAQIVNDIADRWRKRDARAVYRFGELWAPREHLVRHFGEGAILDYPSLETEVRRLMALPGYEVASTSVDAWKWSRGTKVLCVHMPQPVGASESAHADECFIIYGGWPRNRAIPEASAPFFFQGKMYFVRRTGVWVALNPRWEASCTSVTPATAPQCARDSSYIGTVTTFGDCLDAGP